MILLPYSHHIRCLLFTSIAGGSQYFFLRLSQNLDTTLLFGTSFFTPSPHYPSMRLTSFLFCAATPTPSSAWRDTGSGALLFLSHHDQRFGTGSRQGFSIFTCLRAHPCLVQRSALACLVLLLTTASCHTIYTPGCTIMDGWRLGSGPSGDCYYTPLRIGWLARLVGDGGD